MDDRRLTAHQLSLHWDLAPPCWAPAAASSWHWDAPLPYRDAAAAGAYDPSDSRPAHEKRALIDWHRCAVAPRCCCPAAVAYWPEREEEREKSVKGYVTRVWVELTVSWAPHTFLRYWLTRVSCSCPPVCHIFSRFNMPSTSPCSGCCMGDSSCMGGNSVVGESFL